MPATIEQVRQSKWRLLFHADASDHGLWFRQCVAFPRLGLRDIIPRRRGRGAPRRVFTVEGIEQDFEDLRAAVDAMNATEATDG